MNSTQHKISVGAATTGLVATIVWLVNWKWQIVIPGEVAAFAMGILHPLVAAVIPDKWQTD